MHPFPHHYAVRAHATISGEVALGADGTATLQAALPIQLGGPGGEWSSATCLVTSSLVVEPMLESEVVVDG